MPTPQVVLGAVFTLSSCSARPHLWANVREAVHRQRTSSGDYRKVDAARAPHISRPSRGFVP
jgi:hypothetical protein